MNRPTPPVPSHVEMHVHFDVDQNGSDLSHKLIRVSPSFPDPEPSTGPHADSLSFSPGDMVGLRVIGYGSVDPRLDRDRRFVSFQIIDCVIITRPQAIQRGHGQRAIYAAPSPFQQAIGACHPLALDFSSTHYHITPEVLAIEQHWKRTLDVSFAPGMWDLSLVITVRISRGPGSIDEIRVFSFDPEAEVGGNGTIKQP